MCLVDSNGVAGQQPLDVSELNRADLVAGLAGHLGLEITDVSPDRIAATWSATDRLADEHGSLHRGAHSSVIETLASIARAMSSMSAGTPSKS